jgi:hypothetical protein
MMGQADNLIKSVCAIAKDGLWKCYPKDNNQIPYTLVKDGSGGVQPAGISIRYALISQIGITRWLHTRPEEKARVPDLWPRILANVSIINHIGDFALLLWVAAESGRDDCEKFAGLLVQNWPGKQQTCNAVELGWVVQSLVRFSELRDLSPDKNEVLKTAREKLLALYNPAYGLFTRHSRPGITKTLSRQVACFADQVYPMIAFANYGKRFNDSQARDAAVAVADTICRLQGPAGQWWWHYHAKAGKVAEEYPVFSVHQHGMAPMALLTVDQTAGTDHSRNIEASLMWLTGQNELNMNMLEPRQGVIWRDIERKEICKMFRIARGGLSLLGWDSIHRFTGKNWFGYKVNYECRPYELGWILYAWASPAGKKV